MAEANKVLTGRRKGPDAVIKAVWWIVGISWLLIITALLIASEAQPKFETFFDRMVKIPVRNYVDRNLLQNAFYVLLLNLLVCITGFVLNLLRHKRKTDRISKSIIVLGVITLAGILWYLVL